MIHDVDVTKGGKHETQVHVPKLIILTKFSNCTESIPQGQWKAPFCCSVFHQSIIVYIRALILGNLSILVYTKKVNKLEY